MEKIIAGIDGLNQETVFINIPQFLITSAHNEGGPVNGIFIAYTHDGTPHKQITSAQAVAGPASDL